ncbi:MAG TPA: hypothetical protein VL947_06375 [Cytophagales bacterium]|nr:hypothetical protein [Cytophagales bacterium]
MKNEDHIHQQLEDYLANRLSDHDKAAFHKSLQESAELTQKLQAHKLANEMVIEHRLLDVNNMLRDYHKSKKSGTSQSLWAMLLGVALTGAAVLYYVNVSKTTPQINIKTPKQETTKAASNNLKVQEQSITKPSGNQKGIPIIVKSETEVPIQKLPAEQPLLTPTPTSSASEPATVHPIAATKPEESSKTVEKSLHIPKNVCEGVHIHFMLGQKPTCYGEHTGSVWIKEGTGGKSPYTLQLLDEHKQSHSPNELASGTYEAVYTDANGCVATQQLTITHKICEKDYIFNPFAGELLKLQPYPVQGTMRVFDRQGNIYVVLSLQPNSEVLWDGLSKNGELSEGFYNFIAEYADHATAKGTITIVR